MAAEVLRVPPEAEEEQRVEPVLAVQEEWVESIEASQRLILMEMEFLIN